MEIETEKQKVKLLSFDTYGSNVSARVVLCCVLTRNG